MEVVVTDEMDERFIEFCKSFDCAVDDPQLVLLLTDYDNVVACTSFKVFDSDSIEVFTLFVSSSRNQEEISFKLIKQLEKIAIDFGFKNSYVYLDEDDLTFEIFKKLDYKVVENNKESLLKKEFRSLI